MNKFNTFAQTEKGRYTVIGVLTIICGLIFYFIFFSKDSKISNEQKTEADTNVTVRDTAFEKRGNVYTTYDKQTKKVEADADFYKAGTDELKQALNEPTSSTTAKNDEDLQRMADSILRTNQTKVNYGQSAPNKNRSYGGGRSSYTSTPKVDKEKQRQEEIDKFQRNSKNSFNEFFEGANAKKTSNTSPTTTNLKSQNSDAMIYAVINGDQIIKNKDRVTMKLTRDALIDGEVYKKNTSIYGIARFNQNRINLDINNINQKQVSLSVQDAMDGNYGIYIEGESFMAETANEAAEDGISNINVSGIPIGKTIQKLISKKQKEPKVQLLNNYRIILKVQ